MRNKVRKSLAFLLALALVVSVMSGLGLSVSAEQESNTPGTEEVQQQDKTEAGAAPSEVKAEEEAAKPEEKPVQEEKADEQKKQEEKTAEPAAESEKKDGEKAEGEGSGDKEEAPKAPTSNDAEETEKKDEEQQQADPSEEKPLAVMANGTKASQYTVSYNNVTLTVKLVDEDGKSVQDVAPTLEIKKNEPQNVQNFAATVEGYDYYSAYHGSGRNKSTVSKVAYYDKYKDLWNNTYDGWYSVDQSLITTRNKITNNTLYLVYKKKPGFTIHYVDENGKEIAPSKTQDATNKVTFSTYADTISGYTYWRACYSTANNAEITKAKKNEYYNEYTFYNGSEPLKSESTNNGSDESINKLEDIYLVYVKDGVAPTPGGTTGGSGSSIGEPSHTKKAVLNDNGTYDLSLDVSASVGTATSKAILDVVFILDTSGSMNKSISGSYTTQRITSATDAIRTMVNSLAGNGKIDAQFSLVTFAKNAQTAQNWTSSADTLNKKLPQNAGGGTNYQDAFIKGKVLLGSSRRNATKVVVFVSDGNPTYYMSASGNDVKGTGSDDSTGRGMSNARGVVKTMLPNYLFTVGVGDPNEYSKLSQITDAAHPGVMTKNYKGTSTDTLEAAFNDMEGQITSIACEDVTISDKLSTNVAMVMADGKPKKLKGEVTDKNGKLVGTYNSADGSITLPATELNGETILLKPTYKNEEIVWNLPDGYKLEAGYTYTVTANVDVTETAFANYREGNKYPDTPDAGTGTHADKKEDGLFSNDNPNAKLTYTVTGESKSKDVLYQKPVVRLTPSTLTIKKTVTGLDATALAQLKNSLKFNVTYTYYNGDTKTVPIGLDEFTQVGDTYTYTSDNLKCWSMDASYSVEETGYEVEGYDHTGGNTTVSGQIESKNQNEIASFTNNYQHKNVTVTIKKEVTGNMSQTSDKFAFSVTNPSNLAGGDKSFELSADDTDGKAISIPYGSNFTISETPSNGYTLTKVNGEDVTGNSYTLEKVTENTTITFFNDKTIQPPNGIITTIAPYAIMVVLAAGAGVYFVYSRRRRNH